jgi:hypothetical protein
MDALRADSGDAIVLVTPAFPETGRTVYQGNLFVGSVPLNESPLKDHPLNPMHDSNLVRVLARQSRTKVGLVDLATLSRGAIAVRGRLTELAGMALAPLLSTRVRPRSRNYRRVALDHRLSVGGVRVSASACPGAGRLRQVSNRASARTVSGAPVGGAGGRVWPEAARRRPLAQIGNAEKAMAVLHLDPEQGRRRARRGGSAPWRGPSERISGGAHPDRLKLDAGPGRSSAISSWPRCSRTCHRAGDGRYRGRPGALGVRRLVVAGGETSGAVVDRLRIPGFLVGAEIAAGVPVLRAVGADKGEMLLALKSGNFGGTEFFSDALKLMR